MSVRKLRSNLQTSVAYDGGDDAKQAGLRHRVTLFPGVNDISDQDKEVLDVDPHFRKHFEGGFIVVLPDADQPEDLADLNGGHGGARPAGAPSDVVAGPRAKLEGESPAAYKKRMKALDDAADADTARAATLDAYFAADEATRAAMLPTLDDDTKAAIEADDRSKSKDA